MTEKLDRFRRLLELQRHHCLRGQLHYRTWSRLNQSFSDQPDIGNLAPVFFAYTAEAHLNSALLILNRLIDRHSGALSIEVMLRHAESCAGLLDYVSPEDVRKAIVQDRAKLASNADLIRRVQRHRNEQFVHLSNELLGPPHGVIPEADAFSYSAIQDLLSVTGEVLQRYYAYLTGSKPLMEIWDEAGDFDYLMTLLERSIDRGGDELLVE